MNFEPNEEQAALRDSVARVLADRAGFEQRRAAVASAAGWSRPTWAALAELGIGALVLPERLDGFGGGAVDLLPLMEERGRALSIDPFLTSIGLAATALRLGADEATQAELLPPVTRGERLLAWADDEAGARGTLPAVRTAARSSAEGWRLQGGKRNVMFAAEADGFVVGARVQAEPGVALFLVERGAQGLDVRAHRLVDDTPAGELTLADTPARRLTAAGSDAHVATRRFGTALLCGEAVGVMENAFALTVAYLHTRRQFGRAIGENQALRHRVAEMKVAIEMCRSMAIAAAVAIDDPASDEAELDLLRAKLMVGRHGRAVCHAAIQLHGGIGMTEEYAVGHCLRRMTLIDQLFGDADAQAARLAAAIDPSPAGESEFRA